MADNCQQLEPARTADNCQQLEPARTADNCQQLEPARTADNCQEVEPAGEADNCKQVEPAIWKACAGIAVQIPAVGSSVYYLPQGHIEHSSAPESVLPLVSHITPKPFLACRVVKVLYLVDLDTDEVFTEIKLQPLVEGSTNAQALPSTSEGGSTEDSGEIVSFAKVLTPSDANNGGGFSVPRFCADSIFPPLNFKADPPYQVLYMEDLRGKTWDFRHIYRGTPRRHLLTSGWSMYVNSKKLISGDSVVFIKNKVTGNLFIGLRRAKKSTPSLVPSEYAAIYAMALASASGNGGGGQGTNKKKAKVPPESVAKALEKAVNNKPFKVVYYPKAGSQEFVVAAEKVDAALAVCWSSGMRVKMAVRSADSSRITWAEGTVSSVSLPDHGTWEMSPWKLLEVAWDHPDGQKNMKKVSPWQVEPAPPTAHIEMAFPPVKKLRLPQNGIVITERAADYPLPQTNSSNSVIGQQLSSSYFNNNIIPAGMQGARQDTLRTSSSADVGRDTRQLLPTGHADNNPLQNTVVVSTDHAENNPLQNTVVVSTDHADNNPPQNVVAVSIDLSLGTSHSDVSPDSATSTYSSSPFVNGLVSRITAPNIDRTSTIQLFGQTYYTDCNAGSSNRVASVDEASRLLVEK